MKKKIAQKANRKDDYIIIIGCGRLGSHLANLLSASKKSVVIIDKNERSFKRLDPNFSGFTIEADAIEEEVLEEAKIEQADVVVLVTDDDNTNIMLAQIAKKIYNIPKVVARLIEPNKRKIYDRLGVVIICPTILSAEEISKIII